jgi:hypothetical protein
MKVYVRKKNSKLHRKELIYASKWMTRQLLSPQLMKNIKIFIYNKKDDDTRGTTQCIEVQGDKARTFKICIDPDLSRKNQLQTLAHELVHVKQYAKGELSWKEVNNRIRWNNQLIDESTTNYFDLPWEIEAFGREYGLYIRYVTHLNSENIKF